MSSIDLKKTQQQRHNSSKDRIKNEADLSDRSNRSTRDDSMNC